MTFSPNGIISFLAKLLDRLLITRKFRSQIMIWKERVSQRYSAVQKIGGWEWKRGLRKKEKEETHWTQNVLASNVCWGGHRRKGLTAEITFISRNGEASHQGIGGKNISGTERSKWKDWDGNVLGVFKKQYVG